MRGRGRRRQLVSPGAASRRRAPAAVKTSMGSMHVNSSHGHATKGLSPTYRSWSSMLGRVRGTGSTRDRKAYATVTVCDRWNSFENFLSDMGERPDGTSLDRKDNDGNYEPGNCRWATRKEQSRNRRSSRVLEFGGTTRTIAEWAEVVGLNYRTLLARIRKGWSAKRALSEPPVPRAESRSAKLRWEAA